MGLKEAPDDGVGGIVGQVGHNFEAGFRRDDRRQVHVSGVCFNTGEVIGISQTFWQPGQQVGVQFHCQHPLHPFHQLAGEDAPARANLNNQVVLRKVGGPQDAFRRPRVGKKVLAQRFLGPGLASG